MHLFASIDGDAAKPSHQDSHGKEEPLLFHQEVAMEISSTTIEVADDEVPVARVWSKGNDAFFGHWLRNFFREVEPSEENLFAEFL